MSGHLRHIATEPANLNYIAMVEPKSNTKSYVNSSNYELCNRSTSESETDKKSNSPQPSKTRNGKTKKSGKRGRDWQIMEGLRNNETCVQKPEMFEGYIMKWRKWPMKGWHKRLFVLDRGILTYAKTPSEIARGKIHGSIDVGLSVISTKPSRRRIDIDADECIYHLRVKKHPVTPNLKFEEWVSQLHQHRLYRQYEIAYGSREAPKITTLVEDGSLGITDRSIKNSSYLRENSILNPANILGQSSVQQERVAAWVLDTSSLEQYNRELSEIQQGIFSLGKILEKVDCTSIQSSDYNEVVDLTNSKKERKKFLIRRNKKPKIRNPDSMKSKLSPDSQMTNQLTSSFEDITSQNNKNDREQFLKMAKLSSSNPSICPETESNVSNRPQSMVENIKDPTITHPSITIPSIAVHDDNFQLNTEYLNIAKDVHSRLRSVVRMIQTERNRLKQALETEVNVGLPNALTSPPQSIVATLKASLTQALLQNSELKARLTRIHSESTLGESTISPQSPVQMNNLTSTSHDCKSIISDYHDAIDNLTVSESSSEGSFSEDDDEESAVSEVSDVESDFPQKSEIDKDDSISSMLCSTGRRSKLPVPKPEVGDFSLCNFMYKNIGKDLSKVSMPVALNEPLNSLQRLCEELEYSDLLDKSANIEDAAERMMYIAAFAVSAYSSSYYRAGHKPFNPLHGETYECIREDRGFKFIAEQVSHHPPISACFAESENFQMWQDIRVKTKFWGKSMEIQPLGTVHVVLPRYNDHYRWNKVTTCVHNIFSGQRWVDQYGEMNITNGDGSITCKLNFVKASYWTSKRHEVQGVITLRSDGQSKIAYSLFGKWNEALYCGSAPSARCIWRPGMMSEDNELYYGFTRFAVELNELTADLAKVLPPTDTRLRPDQRLLEEGDVKGAENYKLLLEQSQREARKRRDEANMIYEPMWFRKVTVGNEDLWEYNHQYWTKRQNPGFKKLTFPVTLW